jgi:raffinose/stachyose/melibiose transport system substrate-binding protein
MMSKRTLSRLAASVATAALAAGLAAAPAAAQTTVTWMYVDNNPANIDAWRSIADAFEAENPGVTIDMQFLENESYKAKLPALLQSDDAPDMFYSWGGGVLDIQRSSGFLQPVTAAMDADGGAWKNTFAEAAVEGLTFDGDIWAVPFKVGALAFFYNKEMFAAAGVDAEAIQTWDDFLAAIQQIKDAGMTPLGCDGADKWPLHFYYSYLIMRHGGPDALARVKAGEPDAFFDDAFIQAGEDIVQLGAMEPCQAGWQGSKWPASAGMFGDASVAMILSFEDFERRQVAQATDGVGQDFGNIGRFTFPAIEGGMGDPASTLGALNGWAVSANAPAETLDFLRFFSNEENSRLLASQTGIIPATKNTDDAIGLALAAVTAAELAVSPYHQNYLDQDLGPNLGRAVNDVSVELWAGDITPEEAAQTLQDTAEMDSM